MIVLDEELQGWGLEATIRQWYRGAVSHWVRQVFQLPEFKSKTARIGKVALVSPRSLQYYRGGDNLVHLHVWSTAERRKR